MEIVGCAIVGVNLNNDKGSVGVKSLRFTYILDCMNSTVYRTFLKKKIQVFYKNPYEISTDFLLIYSTCMHFSIHNWNYNPMSTAIFSKAVIKNQHRYLVTNQFMRCKMITICHQFNWPRIRYCANKMSYNCDTN